MHLLRVRRVCIAATLCLFSSPSIAEEVMLPGGVAGLARALDVPLPPDRAGALPAFARRIHQYNPRESEETVRLLERLTTHYTTLDRFRALLAAAVDQNGQITLAAAADRDKRSRLEEFVELIDLRLRERNRRFTVEPRNNRDAAERVAQLARLGVDINGVADRLNAGISVQIDIPSDPVEVVLSTETWSRVIFDQKVESAILVPAILADRQAALLAHGLYALDDRTLQYFAAQPQLLREIYQRAAAPFATLAGRVAVADGRMIAPGGDAAVPLWEDVLDERVTQPDRFLERLFTREGGRLAYLWDTVANLDAARQAFVLGTYQTPASARRFRSFVDVSLASLSAWDPAAEPWTRPAHDPAMLVLALRVRADGAPAAPAARRFWDRVFESADLPESPERLLRELREDGEIDAAWLVEQIAAASSQGPPARSVQLQFGQRVFGTVLEAALGPALVALRALPRFPMLMLTLERAGVTSPQVFADAARRAESISRLDGRRAFTALAQFQGAIALVSRMARAGTLQAAQVESLIASLAALPLDGQSRPNSRLAEWLDVALAPTLGGTDGLREELVLQAAAGTLTGALETPDVEYAGSPYRVDLATHELRRLQAARQTESAQSIDRVLALHRVVRSMQRPGVTLADTAAAAATLQKTLALFPTVRPRERERPPGVGGGPDAADTIARAARDLERIKRPQDLRNAGERVERLVEVVDAALADSLVSLVYALELPSPQASAAAPRHDFGLALTGELRAVAAWVEPEEANEPPAAWRVTGSLLGLDVGVAQASLPRFPGGSPEPAALDAAARRTFVRTAGVLNPRLHTSADQAAIAAAVARGHAAVMDLTKNPETLDSVTDRVRLDGWRRRSLRWALAHEPDRAPSYFSMVELIAVGGAPALGHADAWGMIDATGACHCTRLEPPNAWPLLAGRPQTGILAQAVADLQLTIVTRLHELKLPAVLTRPIFLAAVRDFVDSVTPGDPHDWLILVRGAQTLSRERFNGYLASLAVDGPLLPAGAR